MHVKQTHHAFQIAPYDGIQTDGCLYRCLLYAPELFTGKVLTTEEIKRAWHYSIPDYMEDHRNPHQDRCFIKAGGHVQIARIGFHIIGVRDVQIEYRYRRDISPNGDNLVIGRQPTLATCNFFISKCRLPNYNHFYVSDIGGMEKWNPGQSFSTDLLSIRGFYIKVL